MWRMTMREFVLCLVLVLVECQTDRTRQAGTYGSDVVDGVVSMLRDACIYPDSTLFLRRLAYVESQDGTSPATYTQTNNGGIWQIDESQFKETKAKLQPELAENIRNKLGIDWARVNMTDLRKPLYSGLAAALYLINQGAPANVPSNTTEQALYWQSKYRPSGFIQTFMNHVKQLNVGCIKDEKMDLVFLVDTSGRIFNETSTKTFIKNYIQSVKIAPDKVQVAVLSFGSVPAINIQLGQLQNKQTLYADVDRAVFAKGGAELLSALKTATSVFQTAKARSNVVKAIILVSAAKMNLTQGALIQSFKTKNKGISIYTIGTSLSNTALFQVASEPSCAHSYTFRDYASLETIHPSVLHTSCRVAVGLQIGEYIYPCGSNVLARIESSSIGMSVKVRVDNGSADVFVSYVNSQPSKDVNTANQSISPAHSANFFIRDKRPLTIAVETENHHTVSCYGSIRISVDPAVSQRSECQHEKPDIVILLDTSMTRSRNNFDKILDFASRFASRFKVGKDATQIALVTYADRPKAKFWLNNFTQQDQVLNAIRNLKMSGSKSNLASALKFVREQVLTPRYGERGDSTKVLVIVTDNVPENGISAVTEGHFLKDQGVRIVMVATGAASRDIAIQDIASGPQHLQTLASYDLLPSKADVAVAESCGDVQLVCVENGLQRRCNIGDLLKSEFGHVLVPSHGQIPNSPCSISLPVNLGINRFPHPTDKDKFIICDSKGQTYVSLCPVGEIYNGNISECDSTSGHPVTSAPVPTPNRSSSTLLPGGVTIATANPIHQSSTPAPTTGIPSGNPCSGSNIASGLYFHPYPPEPHQYIHCSGQPGASNLEYCQPLKIWRQESLQCEFEFLTDLNGMAIKSIHNPCVTGNPTFYPHPTDKAIFIQCDAFGQGFLLKCPPKTVYHASEESCGA